MASTTTKKKTITRQVEPKSSTKRPNAAKPNPQAPDFRLFPHVLVRIAGGPFQELEKLKAEKSWAILEKVESLRSKQEGDKEVLSSDLHKIIGTTPEMESKRWLINLRRDLFNGRFIKENDQQRLRDVVPKKLFEKLAGYLETQQQIDALLAEGEVVFEKEVSESRQHLRRLAQNETLRKGLILSSQSLLKRLDKYLQTPDDKIGKSERNTEKSLLKYITRLYAKTSPFSTFTNLAMGEISDDLPEGQLYSFKTEDGKPAVVVSHIRLNNFLFAYLKGLLTKHSEIRRHFRLRPNPTLKQEENDQYVFLTNSNNIEAFQRIPANPVLEVFRYVASQQNEGVSLREMVTTILENEYIDASAEELEVYIVQLLDYGFLEYNSGVSGIDPDWDVKLREILAPVATEIELIAELSSVLKELRQQAERYSTASVEARQQILTEAQEQLRSVCMKIHEDAGLPEEERKTQQELIAGAKQKRAEAKKVQAKDSKEKETEAEKEEEKLDEQTGDSEPFKHQSSTFFHFKSEQMFYEDTALAVTPRFDRNEMAGLVGTVHNLLQQMRRFEGHQDERDRMSHYFNQKYSEESNIDLLTFYEDYHRGIKKPQAEQERKQREAAAKRREEIQKQQKEQVGKVTPAGEDNETAVAANENKQEEQPKETIPAIKAREQRNKAWLKAFGEVVNNGGYNSAAINFNLDDILAADDKVVEDDNVTTALPVTASSYGIFVQFYTGDDGRLMGVINSSMPGFGKMLSRFLHIFEDKVTDEVRKWNGSLSNGELFLEDCDASYFNANLHPPLMPYEIWMPNGHNGLPAEQQIAATELNVEIASDKRHLMLRQKDSGNSVKVFDLGFQGHMGRSQLFQLLEKFTIAEFLFSQPAVNVIGKPEKESRKNDSKGEQSQEKIEPKITMQSRVTFESRLVLRRQTWFIPKSLLPFRQPQELTWQYFVRLNRWRKHLGMPTEVFIKVNSMQQPGEQSADAQAFKKIAPDDRKPQYIAFTIPHLVFHFAKLLEKVPQVLLVEEMLPHSQDLLAATDRHQVTECIVQWYTETQPGKENK